MGLVNFFLRKDPQLAGFSFDAVLSESYTAEAIITEYPIESGAAVNDHRAIRPITYTLTGAISNNPLKPLITNIAPGGLSNLVKDNSVVAAVAGLSAGYLAGTYDTRTSSAYEKLIEIWSSSEYFDVETGLIKLKNMVIVRLDVPQRTPENENTLMFVATLKEFITVDRLNKNGQPAPLENIAEGSVEAGSLADFVDRGVQTAKEVGEGAIKRLQEFFDVAGVDLPTTTPQTPST